MAIAGYTSQVSDDRIREVILAIMESQIPQPLKIKLYSVETTVRVVSLTSMRQFIRSRTGRAFSDNSELVALLESCGLEKHTIHRGTQAHTVFSLRRSLRVVAGTDLQQTG